MNKKAFSERDICTKFITPAITNAGWDILTQIREEVSFTKGRVIVRGKMTTRGEPKRADYILNYKPHIPIAVLAAKDNNHVIGAGMQYPPGVKSYNKTKPIRIEEFADERAWWGGAKREGRGENERAWRVPVEEIKAADYNLDRKNPHDAGGATDDPEVLLKEYEQAVAAAAEIRAKLRAELAAALEH